MKRSVLLCQVTLECPGSIPSVQIEHWFPHSTCRNWISITILMRKDQRYASVTKEISLLRWNKEFWRRMLSSFFDRVIFSFVWLYILKKIETFCSVLFAKVQTVSMHLTKLLFLHRDTLKYQVYSFHVTAQHSNLGIWDLLSCTEAFTKDQMVAIV